MKSFLIAGLVIAGLCGGCATSRLETRIAELEKELAATRAAPGSNLMPELPAGESAGPSSVPPPMPGGISYGYPRMAAVHVNTDPVASALRRHRVHNHTEGGIGVAVQEGAVFAQVDAASGIMVNIDGTAAMIPVVPPGISQFEVTLLGQPRTRHLTFLCIEAQPDGTGIVVGKHPMTVPFGAGGYDTVDSYLSNYNCVGRNM